MLYSKLGAASVSCLTHENYQKFCELLVLEWDPVSSLADLVRSQSNKPTENINKVGAFYISSHSTHSNYNLCRWTLMLMDFFWTGAIMIIGLCIEHKPLFTCQTPHLYSLSKQISRFWQFYFRHLLGTQFLTDSYIDPGWIQLNVFDPCYEMVFANQI